MLLAKHAIATRPRHAKHAKHAWCARRPACEGIGIGRRNTSQPHDT